MHMYHASSGPGPFRIRLCRYDEKRGSPRCLKLYMTDGALQLQPCPVRHYLDRKGYTALCLHGHDVCHSSLLCDKGPRSVGRVHICGFEQEPIQGLAPLMEAGFKVLHSPKVIKVSPCPQECKVFLRAATYSLNACR